MGGLRPDPVLSGYRPGDYQQLAQNRSETTIFGILIEVSKNQIKYLLIRTKINSLIEEIVPWVRRELESTHVVYH